MAVLNQKDLEQVLNQFVDLLQQKNMLPKGADKQNIIQNVIGNLINSGCELDKDDLNPQINPEKCRNLQKALMIAVIAEAIPSATKDHKLKFDYSILFKPRDHEQEVKNDLKHELKNLLTMLNLKLSPSNQMNDKKLDDMAESLSKDLTKKFMRGSNEEKISDNSPTVDIFAELTCSLCSLYGGVDPRITGGIPKPVPQVMGNLAAMVDFSAASGSDERSFMAEVNTADPGKTDPTGAEQSMLTNAISNGDMFEELEDMLDKTFADLNNHATPSPFSTRPKPPTG